MRAIRLRPLRLLRFAAFVPAIVAMHGAAIGDAPAPAPQRSARARETEAIMRDFMRIQYDGMDLVAAKAKYYTPDFVQHNPEIAGGQRGDKSFIDARAMRDPVRFRPVDQWVNKVDHTMVDDKYFVIHHRLYTNPDDPGRVFMDIWRVENGKMVEHWDIIQPIPVGAKNANTMWSDLAPASAPAPGDPDPEAVIRNYLRIGLDGNDPVGAAEKYVAANFRQHSPHIPDGKAALIAYFKARHPASAAAPRFNYVSHIISDGDLVLVTRHTGAGPSDLGFMYADLFRIRAGKITEHWDVIQAVPETTVNGNKMW